MPPWSLKSLLASAALLLVALALAPAQPTADAAGPSVHSPRYLEKHCPIAVPVNVFAPGGTRDVRHGVTVHGQKINGDTTSNPLPYPIVRYTWKLTNAVEFCGIVGVWPGIKAPEEVSLRPSSQTAHSGEYTDSTSLDSANGLHLSEFFVYARPKAAS